MPGTINTTLIIRFSSVGDIVLSSALVRVLRKRFPQCRLDFLLRSNYGELMRHNPHLSTIREFPAGGDLLSLRRTIRFAEYDLIVDVHNSLRSRFLCWGAPNVVRMNKRKFARFLLVRFKWDVYRFFGGAPGVAERYMETVQRYGIEDDGGGAELFVSPESTERARRLLHISEGGHGQRLIGVCPSAKHGTKMWLKERFAGAASELAKTHCADIVLFGSTDEADRCRDIASQILRISPDLHVIDCAGKLTLLETAAAMDHCSLIITNDTGLMHLAAARGRKIVAIFGSTVRQFGFFPPEASSIVVERADLRCRPCSHIGRSVCPKGHFKCMSDIPSAAVVHAANRLLQETAN